MKNKLEFTIYIIVGDIVKLIKWLYFQVIFYFSTLKFHIFFTPMYDYIVKSVNR